MAWKTSAQLPQMVSDGSHEQLLLENLKKYSFVKVGTFFYETVLLVPKKYSFVKVGMFFYETVLLVPKSTAW